MSLLKYIERIKRLDDLIRRSSTGDSREFSKKMGLSRTVLMENIRDMRQLGAPISYCKIRNTYYYSEDFELKIGLDKSKMALYKGGMELFYENS